MRQKIRQDHKNMGGGYTKAVGLDINWQDGVLDGEPNGCFVETVIRAAIGRLEHYQSGSFPCEENDKAIKSLKLSLNWLDSRRADRESRGVSNSYNP